MADSAVLGKSESEDMPLDWEETARLDVEPFEFRNDDNGWIALIGLLSSNGIGLVVVRAFSCSRMIRTERTRLR